jgi:hypothetical protein
MGIRKNLKGFAIGHSHTLLGSMDGAEGPYPTIEKNLDGDEVFIVTSYREPQ